MLSPIVFQVLETVYCLIFSFTAALINPTMSIRGVPMSNIHGKSGWFNGMTNLWQVQISQGYHAPPNSHPTRKCLIIILTSSNSHDHGETSILEDNTSLVDEILDNILEGMERERELVEELESLDASHTTNVVKRKRILSKKLCSSDSYFLPKQDSKYWPLLEKDHWITCT